MAGSSRVELRSSPTVTHRYLLAAAGPFTIGLLHEATGGWRVPFGVLLVVIAAQTVAGGFAGRDRHV